MADSEYKSGTYTYTLFKDVGGEGKPSLAFGRVGYFSTFACRGSSGK